MLQDLNFAAQYADRLVFLSEGKVVVDDSPWSALKPSVIEQVYGFTTLVDKHPQHGFPVVYPA